MIKIIDFYADWCVPCKAMMPIFDELATEYPEIKFEKINIEGYEDAKKLAVTSVPTFIMFRDGIEISRKNGAISKGMFKSWIEFYK